MNARKLQLILEKVAAANHTTPEEVRREMQSAMEAGLCNPDPLVQAQWNAIPRKGQTLTLEEFIDYMVKVTEGRLS